MLPPKKELLLLPLLLPIPILVFPQLPKILPFSPAVPFHVPANSFAQFMQLNQETRSISGDGPNPQYHRSVFQTNFFRRWEVILIYFWEQKKNIQQLQKKNYIFIGNISTAA